MNLGAFLSFAIALSLLLLPVQSYAAFSGLNIIPTADVLAPGEYDIELENDGFFANATFPTAAPNVNLFLTQFGLLPGLEAGVDFDGSANPTFNLKYQFIQQESEMMPNIAIGFYNYHGTLINPVAYLALSKELSFGRGHLGVSIPSNSPSFDFTGVQASYLVGFERELNEWLTLYLDHTSGDGNFSSVGFSIQPWENIGFLAAYQLSNNNTVASDGYTVHLVITGELGPFFSSGKEAGKE